MISGENLLAYPLKLDPEERHPDRSRVPLLCTKEGKMVNIQTKINKLLKALRAEGVVYKINTQQFYSEQQDRLCTKMILWEYNPHEDGETFYSKVELLKHLAERWKEVKDHGSGEAEENG